MPINTYCTVQELRDEGFRDPPFKDSVLTEKILIASTLIEDITGIWFGAKSRTIRIDGIGGTDLPVHVPIVQIDNVTILHDVSGVTSAQTLDLDTIRIYNRHLTMGLTTPDDRNAPRIELSIFFGGNLFITRWPVGQQNIELQGVFGWTELEPTDTVGETAASSQIPLAQGVIPHDVKDVCKRLVKRYLPFLSNDADVADATKHMFATAVETRDQKVQFGGGSAGSGGGLTSGGLTRDPMIDDVLAKYMRPPMMVMV